MSKRKRTELPSVEEARILTNDRIAEKRKEREKGLSMIAEKLIDEFEVLQKQAILNGEWQVELKMVTEPLPGGIPKPALPPKDVEWWWKLTQDVMTIMTKELDGYRVSAQRLSTLPHQITVGWAE